MNPYGVASWISNCVGICLLLALSLPVRASELGADWSIATGAAPWHARSGHEMIAFDDRLWLLGGSLYDDVWHTSDGYSWTRVQDEIPWLGRREHTTEVFLGKMWMMGGKTSDLTRMGDVWNSSDGVNWTLVTEDAFPARTMVDSVVFDNKL